MFIRILNPKRRNKINLNQSQANPKGRPHNIYFEAKKYAI